MMTICFDQEDIKYFVTRSQEESEYEVFELTQSQLSIFEGYCSGSPLGEGTWNDVLSWAEAHRDELHEEAQGNVEAVGKYYLPMGYCAFCVVGGIAAYETTSGTIISRQQSGDCCSVMLPKKRLNGFHHSVLKLLMSGAGQKEVDQMVNPHLYK
jgi:hypothetical protein